MLARAHSVAGCEFAMLDAEITAAAADILNAYHLPANYLNGYYARRVEPTLHKSREEIPNPEVLYHGGYMSLADLQNILRHGLLAKRTQWTALGGAAVYFSSHSLEAQNYIFQGTDNLPDGVGVLFKVKKRESMHVVIDATSNPTRTIFKSDSDVPPEDILEVYLAGETGFVLLADVLQKQREGTLTPHTRWTGAFERKAIFR